MELAGKGEPGRAELAAALGAEPGLTVPSRGTKHGDSTQTCWQSPQPTEPPAAPRWWRLRHGQRQSKALAQPPAARGTRVMSSPGMTMSPRPSMAKLSASSPFSSRS